MLLKSLHFLVIQLFQEELAGLMAHSTKNNLYIEQYFYRSTRTTSLDLVFELN